LDESWRGFDGRGRYDLILFMGFTPAYLSRMLSALKHFSDLITVSIDELIRAVLSLLSGKYLTRAISSPSIESKHRSLIADTIAEDNPTASAG
jgi:hypothetical protein